MRAGLSRRPSRAVAACRLQVLELLLRPLAVVGTMGLSVYALHVLARAELQPQHGWPALGAFCGISLVGCVLWAYTFRSTSLRRGPLEWALHAITPIRKAPAPESRATQEALTLRG